MSVDKASLFGWATVIAVAVFLLAFAAMPGLVMLAIPLHFSSGFADLVIKLLLVFSPTAAATGGGLLIVHKRSAGGFTTALAGIGMLIAWWGPIGWLLGPLFLISGAIGLGAWGKFGLLTSVAALALPLLIYIGAAIIFSSISVESKLAKIEEIIYEVSGTLQWQEEGPTLEAEQARLQALADVRKKQFRTSLIAASFLGGIGAFGIAIKLKERASSAARGLFFGGFLCFLQGVVALLGVHPLL